MNDFTGGTCFVGYSVDYEFGTAVGEPTATDRDIKLLATGSTPDLPFIQDFLIVLGFPQLRGLDQFDRDRRTSRVHTYFGDKDRIYIDSVASLVQASAWIPAGGNGALQRAQSFQVYASTSITATAP